MKLYADPMACSLASHVALVVSGLPHEIVWIDLKTWADPDGKRTADGRDFRAINPKGQVPVLELDDGSRLTEGSAILQYIGDHAPLSGLVPTAGTLQRYRLQEWLNFIATELHKAVFSPYFGADGQKLLPPEDDDNKPDAIAQFRHQRRPARLRQMRPQKRLGDQRKPHR